jgi:hypothetical protein
MQGSSLLKGFAQIYGQDLQRLAVLRYGSTRHYDALLAQNL